MEPPPYQQLILQAREGSRDAFDDLLDHRIEVIVKACASRTRTEVETKEAVADTLFEAWKSIGTLKATGLEEFDAWLKTIARRTANRTYHQRAREAERQQLDDGAPGGTLDLRASVSSHELTTANRAQLEWALDRINPDFAEALVLFEVIGLSYREIADEQCVSVDTVKSRISRSKKLLARVLKAEQHV
ncbi:MAG: RNA polymerase sigma factor [Actinomycetota bacterium]